MYYWWIKERNGGNGWSENSFDQKYKSEEDCLRACYQKITDIAHKGAKEYTMENPPFDIKIILSRDEECDCCHRMMEKQYKTIDYKSSMIQGIEPTPKIKEEVLLSKMNFLQKLKRKFFSLFS